MPETIGSTAWKVSQPTVSAGVSQSFSPCTKVQVERGVAYQGIIFFIPLFFWLDDSFPAGVQGTCLPSLLVVVVTPFLVFAGHGGGAAGSVTGAVVLPAAGVVLDDSVLPAAAAGLLPAVAGCAAGGVPTAVVVPLVEAVAGAVMVLPSNPVICVVWVPVESVVVPVPAVVAPGVVAVSFIPVLFTFNISPEFSSSGSMFRRAVTRCG